MPASIPVWASYGCMTVVCQPKSVCVGGGGAEGVGGSSTRHVVRVGVKEGGGVSEDKFTQGFVQD